MWILKARVRWLDEEKIASFSSKELAEAYIERSKLKRQTWQQAFLKSSLLGNYAEAWVDWEDDCLIHDPEPPR